MGARKNKKFRVRRKNKIFAFIPIWFHGRLYWLSKIIVERAFNGKSMSIINIKKI